MVLAIGALRIRIEWSQMPLSGRRAELELRRQQLAKELEAERHQFRLRSNISMTRF